MLELASILIKRHEGLELHPYKCTSGYLSIAYGRNLDTVGISEEEANILLYNDLDTHLNELMGYKFWDCEELNDNRKAALIDFHFNVGARTFNKFVRFKEALENQDWGKASRELLDSRYRLQVGNRAKTIASIIKTGELPCDLQ